MFRKRSAYVSHILAYRYLNDNINNWLAPDANIF